MNKKFLFVLLIMFFAIAAARQAQARTWLQFFFPTLGDGQVNAEKTLTAPFAFDPKHPPILGQKVILPENAIPVDQPHRSGGEIGKWLEGVVSEALFFQSGKYQDSLNHNLAYFDEGGRQQYMAFLQERGYLAPLQAQTHYIRGFTSGTPLLINKGVVNGRYHWLFEVPAMVSLVERGADPKNYQPTNQRLIFTVQVGRTGTPTSGQDIIIEQWRAKPQTPTAQ